MKRFELLFSETAKQQLYSLRGNRNKQGVYKAVGKTLYFMKANLRHPSLNTHEYRSLKGPGEEKVFESYAQNNTPGAYRVFWHYGPQKDQITVVAIVPHP